MATQSLAALRSAFELANRDPKAFAAKFPAKPAPAPKPRTAVDYRRDVDAAIIAKAGELVADLVPEEHRDEVSRLIANQLHHLSTPALGWPSEVLPVPDRSDWR
jgi:hypothetical protein